MKNPLDVRAFFLLLSIDLEVLYKIGMSFVKKFSRKVLKIMKDIHRKNKIFVKNRKQKYCKDQVSNPLPSVPRPAPFPAGHSAQAM